MNTIKISNFRIGLWVIMLAGVVFFAAQQFPGWNSEGVSKIAGIVFAAVTVWGVFLTGAMQNRRMGIIAAAFMLGNTAFIDAGRSAFTAAGAEYVLGWIMVETLCFLALGFIRNVKVYAAALALFIIGCAAIPFCVEIPAPVMDLRVEGWATVVLGAFAAVVFIAGCGKKRFDLQMPGIAAWGLVNGVFFHAGIIGILPPAALFTAWLIENPEHRRGFVRIAGNGILLGLQCIPLLLVAMWLYMSYSQPEDVKIPMLLPMIIFGILIVCDWMAVRKFKYADRRVVIAIAFAASVVTWCLLLVEPLRVQELNSIRQLEESTGGESTGDMP